MRDLLRVKISFNATTHRGGVVKMNLTFFEHLSRTKGSTKGADMFYFYICCLKIELRIFKFFVGVPQFSLKKEGPIKSGHP